MIAYYAHSEGSGHSSYATIFYKLLGGDIKIMSSNPAFFSSDIKIFKLAKEDPDGTGLPLDQTGVPDYLHYSPVGQCSIQRRSLQILTGLVNSKCKLFIIDVSVEVAALARASSIPFVYVKLPGLRNDIAHLNAFNASLFNIAYYPRAFEHPETPEWVIKKTLYLGYFSRFSYKQEPVKLSKTIQKVLIIKGRGEGGNLKTHLSEISKRFKGLQIYALGDFSDLDTHISGIDFLGFEPDIEYYLKQADIVIASCGLNLTSEILALGKLYCCIPEERPFKEQEETARNLYKHELAFSLADLLLLNNDELLKRLNAYRPAHNLKKLTKFIQWIHENNNLEKLFNGFKNFKENLEAS